MQTKLNIKTKEKKQIVCDMCGCSFDEDEAIQGDDIYYYFCSQPCKDLFDNANQDEELEPYPSPKGYVEDN